MALTPGLLLAVGSAWLLRGRRQALASLRSSEESLALALHCIGGAVLTIDRDGNITRMNRVAEQITGWNEAEARGRPAEEIFRIVDERTGKPSPNPSRSVLATGGTRDLESHAVIVRRDGSDCAISHGAAPIRNRDGSILGVALVFRDVTDLRQMERTLRQGNEQLEQRVRERTAELQLANEALQTSERRVIERTAQLEAANKELESFSYSVSHDLRAPLRHVQGFAEMLSREVRGDLSEKAQRHLATIVEAGREMGQLIDDLLSFSKMGRAEMHDARVDLDELVQKTRQNLRIAVHGRNIVWKIASLPTVQGDPAMLQQVFANLLGNAVKYTRPRDPAVIEIACTGTEGERVVLRVRDNGAGFDMKYVGKLFGVFQRLHRADEFEGTGIGLANVRRIVTRHGGRTWAEAAVDRGASFYFTLKAASKTPTPATRESQ